jgi:hypothetical protein
VVQVVNGLSTMIIAFVSTAIGLLLLAIAVAIRRIAKEPQEAAA